MTDAHRLNRRSLFGAAATGAALAGTGAIAPKALADGGDHWWDGRSVPRRRIGMQLYSMRRLMETKEQGAAMLARLARMGYAEVELAGTFGHTPQELRRLADRLGLRIVSSHNDPRDTTQPWERTLEGAVAMGQEFIGLAWFPEPYNEDVYRRLAEVFNEAGAKAREYGLRFFYHNHDFDFRFKQADGTPLYNIFLDETDPSIVEFELDLYWIVVGGESPIDYLSAAPERYPLYHVKDKTWKDRPNAQDWEDTGPGSLDFPDIFAAGAGRRGWLDKHFIIEHDQPQLSHPGDENAEYKTALSGVEYLRRVRY